MKYFTLSFYFKKITPYSEKNSSKTKILTSNKENFYTKYNFFYQIRKTLHET